MSGCIQNVSYAQKCKLVHFLTLLPLNDPKVCFSIPNPSKPISKLCKGYLWYV
uniref:Uncharacterized protein n=1 Tax=Helianthus annuus TaxID=4232 RepID=A0A251VNW6_HELAN